MISGRCLCEKITFEIDSNLRETAYCHCTKCRRASGSAFAVNAVFKAKAMKWLTGRKLIEEYESSPGKFRAFCRNCGSPIYARHLGQPKWLSIRLGVLDGDPGIRPSAHFNVGSKAPWFTVTDDLPQHAGDTESDPVEE
jgi:hypothetical protein